MEKEKRLDADELLASLEQEGQGKLTIFLGAAAGVGKTYAMLEAAREKLAEGIDIVVGLVETHGRAETEAMLKGLLVIPTKAQDYKGKTFSEMDLDGILARSPQIVLVDELAHTNLIGSRHKKRYMDVQELLLAGISVYTTLNIQHLETLNDIVAQITGITVRETVPDKILETASQIKLIDIPPEQLIQRLKDGKVYIAGQANEALKSFFRPGNINALRELALRYTAQRVDRQLECYMRVHGIAGPWPTGEKVLVCISASPFSAKLIRAAKRMATSQNAEWLAVHVEPHLHRFSKNEAEKDSMAKNLRLAETLGAEIIGLTGDDIADEILEVAIKRNVSQIIIGKPNHSHFWSIVHGSVVDKVILNSQGISIHVIPGGQQEVGQSKKTSAVKINDKGTDAQQRRAMLVIPLIVSFFMIVIMALIINPISSFLGIVNISMLFMLPVLLIAARWGRLPAVITAIMGVLTFDFFFVPPFLSFTVSDVRYIISFAIFVLVALITGTLSDKLRKQINYSRQREGRVSALYALSRDIAAVHKMDDVLESIAGKIANTLEGQVVLLLPNENAKLELKKNSGSDNFLNDSELAVASWVFNRGQKAGKGTETLGAAAALYLPLSIEQGVQGVLGICFNESEAQFNPERIRLLEAFVGLAAMAINRIKLAEQARQALNLVESERLRTALFNSLSHDLRTPLSSIIGAVTGLLEDQKGLYSPESRHDLLEIILHGAERMNRFVSNLLDMARLESGMLKLKIDWCDLQDIIGVAVNRLGDLLAHRPLDIKVQPNLPLVQGDYILIEQVLINLLDNALKYSKEDSEIVVTIQQRGKQIETAVANQGEGIPDADLSKVFDKFYRLNSPLQVSGTGLGLAICKGIIEAHGGEIYATNNKLGGVTITFTLPLSKQPMGEVPVMNEGV